jgi:hypothetical protein
MKSTLNWVANLDQIDSVELWKIHVKIILLKL